MTSIPSEIFKVLGVETRLRIIRLLKSEGPLGAKRISEKLGITPAAVSQHLRVLKQAGFVRSERKGYWIPYFIEVEAMNDCCDAVNDVCRCNCVARVRHTGGRSDEAGLRSLVGHKRELELELKKVERKIAELKRGGR